MKLSATLAIASTIACLALVSITSCWGDDPGLGPGTSTGGSGASGGAGGAGGSALEGILIDGLSAPVQVTYDEHGIVHLTCETDDDCIAALGYVHAANRFFVMDFVRHAMRGRLGALVAAGDAVLESDYFYRQLMSTADGEPLEDVVVATMSSESLGALQRYAAGVNAWLEDMRQERNGATLSLEYTFFLMQKDVINDWEPEDSVAMAFYLIDLLGNTFGEELTIGTIMASLSPTLAADLLRIPPPFADFTVPVAGGSFPVSLPPSPGKAPPSYEYLASAAPLLRKASKRVAAAQRFLRPPDVSSFGSNNWVLGPGRTAGGHAILSNDPHLGMNNPAVFFAVEIDSKSSGSGTVHVAGGSIPALPAVLIGHNEDLAWGVTTANYDLNEVYLETLNDAGDAVWFNGDWVDVLEKELSFANAAGEPVTKTLRWVPHHGPIIEEDLAAKTAITVRWVLHEGMTDMDAFLALNRASQVQDVPQALEGLTATNQNFVVIDRQDNIGWYPLGQIPNRPWASLAVPSWAPVPGDGTAEWSGFIPKAELPQLMNPPNGVIATANQDITGASADGDPSNDGHPVLQIWDTAPGARMHRIVELLEQGGDTHDVDSQSAIQADTRSAVAELLLPALLVELGNLSLSGTEAAARTALEAWQYTCPTGLEGTDPEGPKDPDATAASESIGCTVFHVLLYQLFEKALGDEQVANDVGFFTRMKVHLLATAFNDPGALQSGGSFWDDVSTVPVETRDDVLAAAIAETATLLETVGSNADDWRWGRVHTLVFRSIFDGFGITQFNNGIFTNDGGLYTVDVAAPAGNGIDMTQTHGAAIRVVVEPASDGMHMKWQLGGGTNLDRSSPLYDQFVEPYLNNQSIDFPFGPGAVTNPQIEQVFQPLP